MNVFSYAKKLMMSALLVLAVAIATSGFGLFCSGSAQASLLPPVLLIGSNEAGQVELERAKTEFQNQTSPEVQRAIENPPGKVKRDLNRAQNEAKRNAERIQNEVERNVEQTKNAAKDAAEDAKSGVLDFLN